jgi:3-oxoadipate enol-lactonase/4-carboxymuconolactone decarboxylase
MTDRDHDVDGPKTQDGVEFSAHQQEGLARERGMKVRREVLGDAHVDRAEANKDGFTEDFQDFITRYAWGEVWSRPGLDRRSRSVATLAALVSLRAGNEIGMHVRAALRNGLTPEEIKEVILHTAVYAGVPAANDAFRIAQQVIAEEVSS